jgi:hypothetical protein
MAIFTPSLHMKETIAVPKAAQAVQATVTIKQIAATIAEQHGTAITAGTNQCAILKGGALGTKNDLAM